MTGRDGPSSGGLVEALVVTGLLVLAVGLFVGLVAPAAGIPGIDAVTGTDDEEPRQLHPDETEDGDLSPVERRLADQLAQRARTTNLSEKDRAAVREQIEDTEYERLVEQYAAVSERTDSEEAAKAFRETQLAQREFLVAFDGYWETYDRYQELRTAPGSTGLNETAAVSPASASAERAFGTELDGLYRGAHTLERRADRVNRTGAELRDRYRTLENVTGSDYGDSRGSVARSVRNVTATQTSVRESVLRETHLASEERSTDASITDPLVVSGRVTRVADGTNDTGASPSTDANDRRVPVADGTVRLVAGNESVATTTDAEGRFELVHRPITQRPETVEVTIEYVPANTSRDARARESFDVAMHRDVPDVAVDARPDMVSYNETVEVDGQVTAEGEGVGEVPYFVSVGGTVVAENLTTDGDGSYAVAAPLPSSVPTGEQPVRVVVPLENRTLIGTHGTDSIEVRTQPSTLTLTETEVDGRAVSVGGSLASQGTPIDNETVEIRVNGTTLTTAVTGPDGAFETTVVVPEDRLDGGLFGRTNAVEVAAVYSGAGGNLAPNSDRQRVTVAANGRVPLAIIGGVAILIALVVAYLLGRRPWRSTTPERTVDRPRSAIDAETEDATHPAALLASARAALSADGADPDRAVRTAYAAVRRQLEEHVAPGPDRTHWEFYRDCEAAGVGEETLAALREVTERYERVAYAAETVGVETAEATLDRVEAIVEADGLTDGSRRNEAAYGGDD